MCYNVCITRYSTDMPQRIWNNRDRDATVTRDRQILKATRDKKHEGKKIRRYDNRSEIKKLP